MVLRHRVSARNEAQVICKGSKGSHPLRNFSSPSREPFWDYICSFQSAFALFGLSFFTWFSALLALLRWVKRTGWSLSACHQASETHHRGSLQGSHRSLEAGASDSINCASLMTWGAFCETGNVNSSSKGRWRGSKGWKRRDFSPIPDHSWPKKPTRS